MIIGDKYRHSLPGGVGVARGSLTISRGFPRPLETPGRIGDAFHDF
jgi:hypothetical protein